MVSREQLVAAQYTLSEFIYKKNDTEPAKVYIGKIEDSTPDSITVELHDSWGLREARGLKPEFRTLKLTKLVGISVLN